MIKQSLAIMIAGAVALGGCGSSLSATDLRDCLAAKGDDIDRSDVSTYSQDELVEAVDVNGSEDEETTAVYKQVSGMAEVESVTVWAAKSKDDAVEVADFLRDANEDEMEVEIYGDQVVVVGPYLQDRSDLDLAALDAAFDCYE